MEGVDVPDTDVPEQQRPTWHPDRAVGASWSRAGDAATGASASTVGQPGGQPSGWQVAGQQVGETLLSPKVT